MVFLTYFLSADRSNCRYIIGRCYIFNCIFCWYGIFNILFECWFLTRSCNVVFSLSLQLHFAPVYPLLSKKLLREYYQKSDNLNVLGWKDFQKFLQGVGVFDTHTRNIYAWGVGIWERKGKRKIRPLETRNDQWCPAKHLDGYKPAKDVSC